MESAIISDNFPKKVLVGVDVSSGEIDRVATDIGGNGGSSIEGAAARGQKGRTKQLHAEAKVSMFQIKL